VKVIHLSGLFDPIGIKEKKAVNLGIMNTRWFLVCQKYYTPPPIGAEVVKTLQADLSPEGWIYFAGLVAL
jgi:hypothetical protein